MRMKKKTKTVKSKNYIAFNVIVLCFVLIPLLIWGVSLAKCEILTVLHREEFSEIRPTGEGSMEPEYIKVLQYSSDFAVIYYVGEKELISFNIGLQKKDGKWERYWENVVWTRLGGSASEVVWPYWHHFVKWGFA